jgi:hypothetical protein
VRMRLRPRRRPRHRQKSRRRARSVSSACLSNAKTSLPHWRLSPLCVAAPGCASLAELTLQLALQTLPAAKPSAIRTADGRLVRLVPLLPPGERDIRISGWQAQRHVASLEIQHTASRPLEPTSLH